MEWLIAIATAAGVGNGIAWTVLKKRQDKLIDKKTDIDIEAAQVEIARGVLDIVREQHAQDKLSWSEERGYLRESQSSLRGRVSRLERQHDADVISAATHRAWDDQAFQLALNLDSDFPPPPPIFHGEPNIVIDRAFDNQMTIDLDGVSHEYPE
jgi:hypothetical protein